MELTKEPKTKKEVIEAADDIFDALWHALPKEGNASIVVCACERLVASVLYDIMLWPWTFGNCAIETGSSELRRIIKGGPQATHKIDPVHALLDALYCFDLAEGKVTE